MSSRSATRSPESEPTPLEWRQRIRAGSHTGHTVNCAPGFLQGNLAIAPRSVAAEFLRYCHYNQKPCPLIGVSEIGDPSLPALGTDLDIRHDVPAYRVFRDGQDGERFEDLSAIWREDLVAFVLGCSFSFENALLEAGIPVRHAVAGTNVPMYRTSLPTRSVGPFSAPLVVTLRAFRPQQAVRAIVMSDRFRLAHGAPVHIGDPAAIGIERLDTPDFGDPPVIEDGDVLVYWACGVTPQLALRDCGADLVITHEPGHMLITDIPSASAEHTIAGYIPV